MDFSEIEELAKHDPIVNKCLQLNHMEHVTREQSLVMMVVHLAQQKNQYFKQLVDMYHKK